MPLRQSTVLNILPRHTVHRLIDFYTSLLLSTLFSLSSIFPIIFLSCDLSYCLQEETLDEALM